MKRSEINQAYLSANNCFTRNGWLLPPNAKWDVTDFGLGNFSRFGLTLINLAEEPEYCEKIMYVKKNQTTPAHCHKKKKEDIICRQGALAVVIWPRHPDDSKEGENFKVKVNGSPRDVASAEMISLKPGERVTLIQGVYHEFFAESDECMIGEVSTANDDLHDNFFVNPEIGRFPGVEEDEEPIVILVSDK